MSFRLRYIIKSYLAILLLLVSATSLIAQKNKLKLTTSLAFQGTDERIFGLNEMSVKKFTERNNMKVLPSLFFDIGIDYQLLSIGRFRMSTGIKYAYDWNNSYRIYNHCIIKDDPCLFIL